LAVENNTAEQRSPVVPPLVTPVVTNAPRTVDGLANANSFGLATVVRTPAETGGKEIVGLAPPTAV
jgi:hypothetical protein